MRNPISPRAIIAEPSMKEGQSDKGVRGGSLDELSSVSQFMVSVVGSRVGLWTTAFPYRLAASDALELTVGPRRLVKILE